MSETFVCSVTIHIDKYSFQWPKQPNFSAHLNKCKMHQGCNACQGYDVINYNTNSKQQAMEWKKAAMAVLKNKYTKAAGSGRRKGQGIIQIDQEIGIFNLMQRTDATEKLINLINNILMIAKSQNDNNIENKNDDNYDNDDNNVEIDIKENDFENIYIGNLHEIDNNKNNENNIQHIWTMFVSTNKDKLIVPKTIKQVKYSLHPTFNPSEITVKDAPFKMVRSGWGIFEVGITIIFNDKYKRKDIICGHMLNFEYPVTITYIGKSEGDQTKNDNESGDVCHSKNLKNFK